jgi:hypothetical protein
LNPSPIAIHNLRNLLAGFKRDFDIPIVLDISFAPVYNKFGGGVMKNIPRCCAMLLVIMLIACPGLFARDGGDGHVVSVVKNTAVNGYINVSLKSGDTFEQIGRAEYGIGYSTGAITLPKHMITLPELTLRVKAVGKGISHIDSISLPGYAIADIDVAKEKLELADNDVLEIGEGIDINFQRSSLSSSGINKDAAVEIVARIEPEKLNTMPLRFPPANTYRGNPKRGAFYSYEIGSSAGSLTLNGELADETLGTPFFNTYVPIGSGHPQRSVMTWVKDDGENLFVAVDFLPDNTFDGEVDYAALYIDTPDGVKRFPSSVRDTTWGVPGFTYTKNVDYQHKIYEFSIPFGEIGAREDSERIRLSFEAYGTVAASIGTNATDISYNSIQNEYLITYQAFTLEADLYIDIQAEILDQDGVPLGSPVIIAEDIDQGTAFPDPHYVPDVSIATAFSSVSNRYLVVWAEDNGLTTDIYGRIVAADGTPVGLGIPISIAIFNVFEPDVAYDPGRDRFLVVWTDSGGAGTDLIYGQFVNTDGSLEGSSFAIVNNWDGYSGGPAIAFDDVNDRYLVVFIDNRTGQYDLYGQLVSGDGTAVITTAEINFMILTRLGRDMNPPSIAFDRMNEQYMVAVDDIGIDSVMARLVDKDGNLFDHDGNMAVEVEDDYVLLNAEGERTAVAFNPAAYNTGSGGYGTYLPVWQRVIDDHTDFELIEGVTLDVDADNMGVTVSLVHNETNYIGDRSPALAANSYAGNFLIAYHEYDWNSEGYEVKTVASGPPTPNPGLAWPAGETDGVTPNSGASGSTFTFEVEYFSAAGTAPSIHELWLDLDGDGEYAVEASLPPLPGFRRGGPWGEAALTVLGLLVALSLLPGARRMKGRMALGRLVGAVIVTAFVLSGCPVPNGGTGPNDITDPPVEAAERATMEEVDSGDTNYTDGKMYSIVLAVTSDVTDVSYRFVFSDGTREAEAYGASEMWFTVTQ